MKARLPTLGRIRDSRFLIYGTAGDQAQRHLVSRASCTTGRLHKWFIRQTAFLIAVPEISSNLWIGSTKEGPSLNRRHDRL